ncbi:MAG: hypothetical protein Kow0069_23030 [Promethearchaeota archaeon]
MVLANLLWAAIPLPVSQLVEQYSVFTLVLVRFLPAGAVTLLGVAVIAHFSSSGSRGGVPPRVLFGYLRHANHAAGNLPQWAYILLLGGVGIFMQVAFYFASLKLAGTVLTFGALPASTAFVAVFNWGRDREELDAFNGLYLSLLAAFVLIVAVERRDWLVSLTRDGFAALLGLFVTLVALTLLTEADEFSPRELPHVKRGNYRIHRLLVKAGLAQLVATLVVFPTCALLLFLPQDALLRREAARFFGELSTFWRLLLNWQGMYLALGGTLVPYLLWFAAAAYWPRGALSFSQWGSILSILEPAAAVALGALVLGEEFSPLALGFLQLVAALVLAIRYLHESRATVHALVLARVPRGTLGACLRAALRFRGVTSVATLTGRYHLFFELNFSTPRAYEKFLDWIWRRAGAEEVVACPATHTFL